MENTIVKVSPGKVFAPHDFLEPGTDIVISCGPERNLMVFTAATWNVLQLRLADVPETDTQRKMIRNLLLNFAIWSVVEADHSFIGVEKLLAFAAVEDSAYWIPCRNYVELWSMENFRLGRFVDSVLLDPTEKDLRLLDESKQAQKSEWARFDNNNSYVTSDRSIKNTQDDIPAFLRNLPD